MSIVIEKLKILIKVGIGIEDIGVAENVGCKININLKIIKEKNDYNCYFYWVLCEFSDFGVCL